MKRLLTISLILLTKLAFSQQVFTEGDRQAYIRQVQYYTVNQLLHHTRVGKIQLIDYNNNIVNLEIKADTLWTNAIQYSFKATYSYTDYIWKPDLKKYDKVRRQQEPFWVNERDLYKVYSGDEYVKFEFCVNNSCSHDNIIWLGTDKNTIGNLLGADNLERLVESVKFIDIYADIYEAKSEGIGFYSNSDLSNKLTDETINKKYMPQLEVMVQNIAHPDDPYDLIDTVIEQSPTLIINGRKALGFVFNYTDSVWFDYNEAMNYISDRQKKNLDLFIGRYTENKNKGYRLPFVNYTNVTKVVAAKEIFIAETSVDSEKGEELGDSLFNNINEDVSLFKDMYLTESRNYLGIGCNVVVQIQDPLYPDDPYALIDTTVCSPSPINSITFLEADGDLVAIALNQKCSYLYNRKYKFRVATVYETDTGMSTDYIRYKKHLADAGKEGAAYEIWEEPMPIWLRADQLELVFTKEQIDLILELYKKAKE